MKHEHTSYLRVSGPDGTVERDGFRCNHCQTAILVKPDRGCTSPRMRLDRCSMCNATICQKCNALLAKTLACSHFEKRLEAAERRYELRKAMGVHRDT